MKYKKQFAPGKLYEVIVMGYKLIAIDLDGTLLNDRKQVSRENVEVLKALHDRGVEVLIATGRRYFAAKNFASKLGIEGLLVMANNGTIVRNISNDELKVFRYFEDLDYYNLIERGKQQDLPIVTHVDKYSEGIDLMGEYDQTDKRYGNYLHENDNRYRKVGNLLEVKAPNALALVLPGDRERLERFKKKIESEHGDRYNLYLMDKLIGVSPILEIIRSNSSKWISIEEYAKLNGIKREEIVAIGDDMNDAEMIQKAGLGIAMKNGADGVKEVSDMITKFDNNNSGLARALREVFELDQQKALL